MSKKNTGKAEKLFRKLGKKLDTMIGDLSDLKKNSGKEFQKRMEEVRKSRDSIETEFKEFRERNKDKWNEIEQSLERAGDELKKAFTIAFSKKEKEEASATSKTETKKPENKKSKGKKKAKTKKARKGKQPD